MSTTKVQFPPMSEKDAAQLQRLLQTMGEVADVEFNVSEVKILEVELDSSNKSIASLLRAIALNKKKGTAKPAPNGTKPD